MLRGCNDYDKRIHRQMGHPHHPQEMENISIRFPINPGQVNSLDPKKFGFLLFVDVAGYYVTDFGISLGLTRFNFCRILLL